MKGALPVILAVCLLFSACTSAPVEKEITPDLAGTPELAETQKPTNTSLPSSTPLPTHTSTTTPTLTPAPTLSPALYQHRLEMADYQWRDADFEGAIETLTEILRYSLDQEQKKSVLVLRASAYDDVGNREAALTDYLAVYELGERNPTSINNICWDYALIGEPEKGLPYCEEAVEKETSVSNKDSRGVTNALLGNYDAAVADFQDVVDSLGNDTDFNLSSIYRSRVEWLETLKEGKNPFTTEVLEKLSQPDYLMIANRYLENGLYESAIKVLTKAIKKDQENMETYYMRGFAYTHLEEPKMAIADFNQVLESGYESAEIFYLRGQQYGVLEDFPQTKADMDQAV